jgi:hypothetical protein
MTFRDRVGSLGGRAALVIGAFGVACAVGVLSPSSSRASEAPGGRTFASPEDAVKALAAAVKASSAADVLAVFGPEAKDLVETADVTEARQRREVFAVAAAERWALVDAGPNRKTLVVGNENWPFPIPLVKNADGWRFDVAAGREEVIARRIGRNELAAIRVCRTYTAAQRLYAQSSHDAQPAGVFASTFRSDPGRQNGLYWAAAHGQKRSPLGDLVADAELRGRASGGSGAQPAPFHGYYFKILTGQGPAAPGGARDYVVSGRMSGGFALVAWPAEYDVTGIMTFLVNQDGTVSEKDLGPDTGKAGPAITVYNPDSSWAPVH